MNPFYYQKHFESKVLMQWGFTRPVGLQEYQSIMPCFSGFLAAYDYEFGVSCLPDEEIFSMFVEDLGKQQPHLRQVQFELAFALAFPESTSPTIDLQKVVTGYNFDSDTPGTGTVNAHFRGHA